MNIKQILTDFVLKTKNGKPGELTFKEQYNIELLEQRIMYSATQCGGAFADGGFDYGHVEDVSVGDYFDHGDDHADGEFGNDIFAEDDHAHDGFGNDIIAGDDHAHDEFGNDIIEPACYDIGSNLQPVEAVVDQAIAQGNSAQSTQPAGTPGNEIVNDTLIGQPQPIEADIVETTEVTEIKVEEIEAEVNPNVGIDEVIRGTAGDDDIDGTAANETVQGFDGRDHLHGQAGDDTVSGGNGNDVVEGNSGNDIVIGGQGNDEVLGGSGDDFLQGGDGDDFLNGGGGDELLEADALVGGTGNDIIDGGAGNDTLQIEGSSEAFAVEALDKGGVKLSGPDGSAVVTNVERFHFLFDDVTLTASELTDIARRQQS